VTPYSLVYRRFHSDINNNSREEIPFCRFVDCPDDRDAQKLYGERVKRLDIPVDYEYSFRCERKEFYNMLSRMIYYAH
jgi:hypothetical protein